jgi:anti-sigma B factor antagonist
MDSVEAGDRAPLRVDVKREATRIVVRISGELDLSNVEVLEAEIDEALISQPDRLTFDLADLRFLDSSGIGLLLRTSSRVGELRLQHPSEMVRQIVEYMGLSGILSMDP